MSTNLHPVVCKNETEVGEVAFDGVRRRPVVAINDEGKLVVCCRRTASKHGWKVQGTLHQRTRKTKDVVTTAKVAAKTAAPAKKRRITDNGSAVVVSKKKMKEVKDVVDSAIDDILGK